MDKKEKEVRCIATELRATGDDGRTIEGKAVVFNSWSEPMWRSIESIDPNAFDNCDMSDVILNVNHDDTVILGRTISGTLKLEVRSDGLYFVAEAPNTTDGNDTLELLRRGDLRHCSFAFTVAEEKWREATPDNGMKYHQRTITAIDRLFDVSVVVHPAYTETEATARSLEKRRLEFCNPEPIDPDKTEVEERERRNREYQYLHIIS
ncbi:MAG: HK97 family phage prohead protease [Rikenellaceae bacterium]